MTQRLRFSASTKVLFAAALVLAEFAQAQKREDFLSIQRDVAQMQDQLKQMQTSQDQKLATLQQLIEQTAAESAKISASVNTLQKAVNDRFTEQQGKLEAPIANLNAKLDENGEDVRTIRESVAALSTRLSNLDNKLSDISSAIRTLSTPTVAPPPPAAGGPGGAPGAGSSVVANPNAPPPGVSAESLWTSAYRDYNAGNDKLAMDQFLDFLKYFPLSENAPSAQYYIGSIYDRAKQFEDALDAYDAVLERYPDNPRTPDAQYMKGVELMKLGRKTAAGTEFKEFLAKYPTHSSAANARAHLRELGLAPASGSSAAKKKATSK